ncbi:MAG: hypothetical protein RKH07_01855 [Gammaproteobacteria bacterium]
MIFPDLQTANATANWPIFAHTKTMAQFLIRRTEWVNVSNRFPGKDAGNRSLIKKL